MDLSRDFREFFESLDRNEVRYLVVGGYALAAHGAPRFTKDLDIWIWMDSNNSRSLIAALDEFGFGGLGLTENDFLEANTVVQLGYPPQRIDLITTPSGVSFETAWEERMVLDVGGMSVCVIGLDSLIANKAAAGRDQDLVDVKTLRRLREH